MTAIKLGEMPHIRSLQAYQAVFWWHRIYRLQLTVHVGCLHADNHRRSGRVLSLLPSSLPHSQTTRQVYGELKNLRDKVQKPLTVAFLHAQWLCSILSQETKLGGRQFYFPKFSDQSDIFLPSTECIVLINDKLFAWHKNSDTRPFPRAEILYPSSQAHWDDTSLLNRTFLINSLHSRRTNDPTRSNHKASGSPGNSKFWITTKS